MVIWDDWEKRSETWRGRRGERAAGQQGDRRSSARKELQNAHLADAADVLLAVLGAEAEVLMRARRVVEKMSRQSFGAVSSASTLVRQESRPGPGLAAAGTRARGAPPDGRTLLRPKRTLSPSRRNACSLRWSRCCSSAVAMVDWRVAGEERERRVRQPPARAAAGQRSRKGHAPCPRPTGR